MAKQLNSNGEIARRNWIIVGLGVFLVATITLVAFAVTRDSADEASLTPSTAAPSSAITASPTPMPTADPNTAPAASTTQPPTRLVSALDADTAWRSVTGDCGTSEAVLERTDDGGATWETFPIYPDTDARSVSVLRAVDSDFVYMVGERGTDCSPIWVGTFTAGNDWREFSEQLSDTWYVDDLDRSVVYAPGGASNTVCESVASLAVTSDTEAAALCSDQTLILTDDGGATWGEPLPVAGAVAIDKSDSGYVVASLGQPDCAGIRVSNLDLSDSNAAEPIGCLPLEESQLDLGTPAISFADGILWLWAGDSVRTSLDAGATW